VSLVWLIQSNLKNQTTANQIRATLELLSTDFISVPLVPFSSEIPEIKWPSVPSAVICWGPSFVPRMLNFSHLSPGIWYHQHKFKWSVFHAHWGDLMLSRDGTISTFKSVISNLSSDPIFIRPDEDNKAFTGGVFSADLRPKLPSSFDENLPVITSRPQRIEHEWRFFIVGKTIAGASSYRVAGVPNTQGLVPEIAINLVKLAINKWRPADVFCLDIGFNGERYGIVEANCFNASRFYQANTVKVIQAINAFIRS